MKDIITNVELSPCIVAKARVALGLSDASNNFKKCSLDYWNRVIDALENKYPDISPEIVATARLREDLYMW